MVVQDHDVCLASVSEPDCSHRLSLGLGRIGKKLEAAGQRDDRWPSRIAARHQQSTLS